jgi:hypothetical protein
MALLSLAKGVSTSPAIRGANGAFVLGKRGLHQPGPTGCKWRFCPWQKGSPPARPYGVQMAYLPLAKGVSTSPALRGENGAFVLGKRGLHQPDPTGRKWRKGIHQPLGCRPARPHEVQLACLLVKKGSNGAGFNFSFLTGMGNHYTC